MVILQEKGELFKPYSNSGSVESIEKYMASAALRTV